MKAWNGASAILTSLFKLKAPLKLAGLSWRCSAARGDRRPARRKAVGRDHGSHAERTGHAVIDFDFQFHLRLVGCGFVLDFRTDSCHSALVEALSV